MSGTGKRSIIIDVDFRKPALYKIMERDKRSIPDIVSFIDGNCEIEDIIHKIPHSGVDMVMNFGARKEAASYIRSVKLAELLDYAEKNYDYVILDASPIIVGTDVQLISDIVDCSIVVVRHDYVRIDDINAAISDIKEGNSNYLGYVLNDYRELNMQFTGENIYSYGNYDNYEYGNKTPINIQSEELK